MVQGSFPSPFPTSCCANLDEWYLLLRCCYVRRYHVHTPGRSKTKGSNRKLDSIQERKETCSVTLSSPLIGHNCVTWPPLPAKESGEEFCGTCNANFSIYVNISLVKSTLFSIELHCPVWRSIGMRGYLNLNWLKLNKIKHFFPQ